MFLVDQYAPTRGSVSEVSTDWLESGHGRVDMREQSTRLNEVRLGSFDDC